MEGIKVLAGEGSVPLELCGAEGIALVATSIRQSVFDVVVNGAPAGKHSAG